MKKKLLILGCGQIFKKHFKSVKSLGSSKFNIVGICDKNKKLLRFVSKKYKIEPFDHFEDAVRKCNPEIVSILLPTGYHFEYILKSLKLNLNVIVEKPMCLKISEAKKVLNLKKKMKKQVFVIMQNKLNIPVKRLTEDIKKNKLGRVFHGSVIVRWRRDQQYYDKDKWRGTLKNDGGVIANQASHHIDLLRSIMGRPKSVFAKFSNHIAKIEAEDTALIIIKFEKNKTAIVEATTAMRPKNIEGSISIIGTKGSVKIGGFALNEIEYYNIGKTSHPLKSFNNPKDFTYGHKKFYDHVYSCLKNKKDSEFSCEKAIETVKLISAIYRSAETNREVFFKNQINSRKLGV